MSPCDRNAERREVVSPSRTGGTHSSHCPLERYDSGGEVRCRGSPCSSPRRAQMLWVHDLRPPFALRPCGRRQGESEQRLNLLERQDDDRSVAMFQVGVERSILARNVRRTLLQEYIPRRALGTRCRQTPSNPYPPEQRRPIGHAGLKSLTWSLVFTSVTGEQRHVCAALHTTRLEDLRGSRQTLESLLHETTPSLLPSSSAALSSTAAIPQMVTSWRASLPVRSDRSGWRGRGQPAPRQTGADAGAPTVAWPEMRRSKNVR